MDDNTKEGIAFPQPTTLEARQEVATRCCQSMAVTMPVVVDDMNNSVDTAYAAWPERMFVIDRNGHIAYAGSQGPWGFKPNEVERWLRRHVGRAKHGSR